ncbi:hypothetical protein ACFPT7_24455 [Acidicapsa dinghuensis]|uniref:Uncharacterized protein n=1 Tax=Acidicapsa dinghuensis TaxID=2218256 RepID=A0ABW1EQC3_9BACT|nr:hypothetical protein [Acidicapsa dinghuensis]
MKVSGSILQVVYFISVAGMIGCTGGGTVSVPPPPGPNAVIFVAQPPTSLAVNASASLVAAATYTNIAVAGENTAVTWSVACGSAGACGAFSSNADAAGITYTAPAVVPSGGVVTVTATSVADGSKSVSTAIKIVPPIPVSVTFFAPPPASMQVGSSFGLNAAIANDVTANPQVKWTVACSSIACGSFAPATTYSEAATTYTAPATVPSDGSVTVTATSVTDTTKSVSTNIVITPAASTLANGTYVFQISGQTGITSSFITGVFTASNGVVTGGEQDWAYLTSDADDNTIPATMFQSISGGSYATTPDGNLEVSLQVGPGQIETLEGTLASGAKGFVNGLNGALANGTLERQTSIAPPSGGYAVSLFGSDKFTDATWMGGVLNVDSAGGISGNGSILDVIDSYASFGGTQTIGASTVSAPDANGRVQIALQPSASSPLPTLYLAGYVVDSSHIRLVEVSDTDETNNFNGVLGGVALGQGASTGTFSAASIAGSSYVFGAQGSDARGPLQIAGVLTPKADGSVTGTLNWNDGSGSAAQAPETFTGSYTVDPTGRMTLTNLSDGSAFNYSLRFYLTSGGALLLSSDSSDIFNGEAFLQQSAAFTAASFNGNYGLNAMIYGTNLLQNVEAMSVVGPITAVAGGGSVAVSGYADAGVGNADFAIAGSFMPSSNGVLTGTLTGLAPSAPTLSQGFSLYLVDPTQGILIGTDSSFALGRVELSQ